PECAKRWKMRVLSFAAAALALAACATAPAAPAFSPARTGGQAAPSLARTQRLHLAPDLSALTSSERAAVAELLAAGERLHRLYMDQRHPQALAAADYLAAHPELEAQRDLFRLNSGPIATTLENSRAPILTVS